MEPTSNTPNYYVVLLAAGQGTRFATARPKQWTTLGEKLVVEWALEPFLKDQRVVQVALVIQPDYWDMARKLAGHSCVKIVTGGSNREESTRAGLAALDANDHDFVLIHDAARPLAPPRMIDRVLSALTDGAKAVVPALPITDTIKHHETGKTVDRQMLCRAQTPQGFPFTVIHDAHQQGLSGTDDANLVEHLGYELTLVEGDEWARKLTTPYDKFFLEALMHRKTMIRTGFGFDVHAFMQPDNQAHDNGDIAHSKELILGGVCIPKNVKGAIALAGHSDADVVLHCVTDALLGAISDGDIGQHFPPSDPQWRGAASSQFLRYAVEDRLALKEACINNIDVTIICEQPKIGPFRDPIAQNIAKLCAISPEQVSVKASTTERLGFTGRGEGIACQAIATVVMPCP